MSEIIDIEEVIRKKRDIRKFSAKEIPDQILNKILTAGRLSQSSKNSQPWHFVIVKNKDTLRQLAACTYSGDFIPDAPLAIAIIMENGKLESDIGRCVQNMMLVAWKYGIGSCWITNFWEKAKAIIDVPMTPNYKLITIIPFGYTSGDDKPQGKKIRKPLSEIAHAEKFGNSINLDDTE